MMKTIKEGSFVRMKFRKDFGWVSHDDFIKWKHFPHYWPFVRGIHRSPVNSPRKCQWRGALMFCLICASIKDWINNGETGDLRRHRAHYDVIVMGWISFIATLHWPHLLQGSTQSLPGYFYHALNTSYAERSVMSEFGTISMIWQKYPYIKAVHTERDETMCWGYSGEYICIFISYIYAAIVKQRWGFCILI